MLRHWLDDLHVRALASNEPRMYRSWTIGNLSVAVLVAGSIILYCFVFFLLTRVHKLAAEHPVRFQDHFDFVTICVFGTIVLVCAFIGYTIWAYDTRNEACKTRVVVYTGTDHESYLIENCSGDFMRVIMLKRGNLKDGQLVSVDRSLPEAIVPLSHLEGQPMTTYENAIQKGKRKHAVSRH